MKRSIPASAKSDEWETPANEIESGSSDAVRASWFLTDSWLWPILIASPAGPALLGITIFILIVLTILLSPSTDSRFIYTDF